MMDDMVDMVMSIETMTVKYNTLKKMSFVNDWLVTRFSTLGKKHYHMYILLTTENHLNKIICMEIE
jgi:hypothetical protein